MIDFFWKRKTDLETIKWIEFTYDIKILIETILFV